MVHIEDKYIDSEGTYDLDGALADPNGLAVLGIFFDVDPKKPQVNQRLQYHCYGGYKVNQFEQLPYLHIQNCAGFLFVLQNMQPLEVRSASLINNGNGYRRQR